MANQNPYKKAAAREKIPPGGYPIVQQTEEKPAETVATEEVKEPPKKEESVSAAVEFSLDSISLAKKDEKSTHSVYLSDSTWNELENRAKKAKMSPSAYLDEILKKVFAL